MQKRVEKAKMEKTRGDALRREDGFNAETQSRRGGMNMNIGPMTTDLDVVSSYVEDDKELNILVSTKISPDEKPGDPELRWTVIADPESREVIRVDFCVATDEGFDYPEYTPTDEQMALFKKFAKECA